MTPPCCSNPSRGLSLNELPTPQTRRNARVSDDHAVLIQHDGAILRARWVVDSTLQTEPLPAAFAARQRLFDVTESLTSIIKRGNGIHEMGRG